jgi:hypothetical protein
MTAVSGSPDSVHVVGSIGGSSRARGKSASRSPRFSI